MKAPTRIRNPETLLFLGQQLRHVREAAGLSQSRVKNMRQATVSKIENGLDVTLDTLLTYAAALGLELALLPVGQALPLLPGDRTTPTPAPLDLLTEFDYLKDPS
jgi:transcriptional regulator with XRE-family HTH domain